ncbi:MAG TPA: multifunctional transcriptional regulator/nicotinamide-nucleotide adenylyltransferase/ribosylnicotinamide kinase NadR, partial [Methylophaga sp.]|nr:multifunctional transcriptional regulator/nicotinamide-nucleotide adenylyltransferase/ribosylnicotinamide kinase NadR [Methylophaga sp.]
EEYGRYYSADYLGGNENLFQIDDFARIARIQQAQDEKALKAANRICFFDTDAVVTQYYCHLYLKNHNPAVYNFVDPQKYDVVLMMSPSVKWVDDGLRFKEKQEEREHLHKKLLYMYEDRGFRSKIIEINDEDYSDRLEKAINISDELLTDKSFMSRY